MKTKQRTLLLVLFAALCSLPMRAQDAPMAQKLIIIKNNNVEVTIFLKEEPIITFDSDNPELMIVTTNSSRIELQTYELNRMIIDQYEDTKINLLNADKSATFSWKDEALIVDVTSEYSSLSIYRIDGKLYYNQQLQMGKHAISLSQLPKGTYIIKINADIIKISK